MRDFLIEDEGDAFQVSLMEGGVQVGGALFPDDGTGAAFLLAQEVAMSWCSVRAAS